MKFEPIDILKNANIELTDLVNEAYKLRKKYWGKKVNIHVLNNVQNGGCNQNCKYCAQSKDSESKIKIYPMKSEVEILAEAKAAYEAGAYRYCMVFSGEGPSKQRIDQLVQIITKIKLLYKIQVCVSPGNIDKEDAEKLKKAGLNRLNHNINTSKNYYGAICSSHSFQDRLKTIRIAKSAGLEICSGIIVGMGESHQDIIDAASTLRNLKIESIPINYFIPIEGLSLKNTPLLTPEYALRVLCLFRLMNPEADIRIAAGREMHLRSLQSMALYVANSLFMNGYLNTDGDSKNDTLKLIEDSGLQINSAQTSIH